MPSRCASVYCNFVRIHGTLRVTPAVESWIVQIMCWSVEEMILMADSYMPKPAKRGPYKKQISN